MATSERVSPNQSLYIQNLPEKLQKEDLRRELYMLFSTYGSVLDITAMNTKQMRGQAHILFKDVDTAVQAMRACQGFDFFGREMRINFAKARSQTLAKMSGVSSIEFKSEEGNVKTEPGALPPPEGLIKPPTLPANLPKPPSLNGLKLAPPPSLPELAPSPQGVKRHREESDEEAPMDEESGEGEMDMSEDED